MPAEVSVGIKRSIGVPLEDTIEGILNDVVRAQHEVNRRSVDIAKEYERDPLLGSFPVPYLRITLVELNLRYGAKSDGPNETLGVPTSEIEALLNAAERKVMEALEDAVKNPKHPQYEDYEEWLSMGFDPEHFDIDVVNTELHRFGVCIFTLTKKLF